MFYLKNNKQKINNSNSEFTIEDFLTGTDSPQNENISRESTYYTCIRILSETLSKLELKLYKKNEKGGSTEVFDTPYYNLISKSARPHKYLSGVDFWTLMEYNRNHYGNCYAKIERRLDGTIELVPLDPSNLQIYIDNTSIFNGYKIYYKYIDINSGQSYTLLPEDVIHIKNFDTDPNGIVGISVREKLYSTIANLKEGQELIRNLYKNGLHSKSVLQFIGSYDPKKGEKIKKELLDSVQGVKNAGGVIPIPLGFKLEPLKISLTDAQFLEINHFNTLQIISAFKLKAHQVNFLEKSSYSTLEQQQLDFYINTMSINICRYEQELNYKLLTPEEKREGLFFKFDIEPMLKGDFSSQINAYAKAVNNGIMTPNEVREKMNTTKADDGDLLICNSNYIPLKDVTIRSSNSINNNILQQESIKNKIKEENKNENEEDNK